MRQMPEQYAKGGRKMVRKTEMFEALPVSRIEQLVGYELARPPVLIRGVGPKEFSEDIEPDLHRLLCEIRGQKEDEKMDRSLRTGGFKSVVITCNDGSTYEGRIKRIEGCPFRADSLTVEAEVLREKTGIYGIKEVVFANPSTIVKWSDGTKTVVTCQDNIQTVEKEVNGKIVTKKKPMKADTYSKEVGLAMCIAKKWAGNQGNFNNVFRQYIDGYTEDSAK